MDLKLIKPGMIIVDYNRAKIFRYDGVEDFPKKLTTAFNHWFVANEQEIEKFNTVSKGRKIVPFKEFNLNASTKRFEHKGQREYMINCRSQYIYLELLNIKTSNNLTSINDVLLLLLDNYNNKPQNSDTNKPVVNKQLQEAGTKLIDGFISLLSALNKK